MFVDSGVPIPVNAISSLADCGYTSIFFDSEDSKNPVRALLPLPWNQMYKAYWRVDRSGGP
jgi:hypothetical protein